MMRLIATLTLCLFAAGALHFSFLAAAAAAPAYEAQTWAPGRQLVWSQPGQSGELGDAANWINKNGTRASSPPDRNTDILLPAATSVYSVTGNRLDQVRHVTIESNARLLASHRNELEIWGNCHVKQGGWAKYISIRGDRHTFFKIDDADYPSDSNQRSYTHASHGTPDVQKSCRSHICHKFQVLKVGTASVEFIGNFGVSDEVMLQHGRMILNGEFRYSGSTGKGAFEIYDGGILELQSGARIAPFVGKNRKAVFNVNIYRNGTLQAGSPQRPLTSNAYLLLGFEENLEPGVTGLYAAVGSALRVYTADSQNAHLVISSITSDPSYRDGEGEPVGNPQVKAEGSTGTAMQLAGNIDLNHVTLDYVSEKGIGLSENLDPSQWTDLKLGRHCAAGADQLFAPLGIEDNIYYHKRNDENSEYGLTLRAVAEMQAYLETTDPFRLETAPPSTRIIADIDRRGRSDMQRPVAVIFEHPIEITIESRVPGAKIRYTLDGSEPSASSPLYEGPIHLDQTTRLTAKAYKPGVGFSPVFVTTYVFK